MSDELIVSGGGIVAVSSDEVLGFARRARATARELDEVASRIAVVPPASGAEFLAGDADRSLDHARRLLLLAEIRCTALATALEVSALAYGAAEHIASAAMRDFAASAGWMLGAFGPGLGVFLAPIAIPAASGLALGALFAPEGARRLATALGEWGSGGAITDPTVVTLLRLLVSSADDVVAGSVGVGLVLNRALGDEGLGVTGLHTAAALATLAGNRAGAFAESRVRTTRVSTRSTSSPSSIRERIDRIPHGTEQVRIDRIPVAGEPDHFEVYIGGTADFSLVSTDEPWDMTSNVRGVAGVAAGSFVAVRQALDDAGVTAESPIVFTGYSQGGLAAAWLAASGDFAARGLVTVGAPAGHVRLPEGLPAVVMEHSDDIVPATGGFQINRDAVVIRREVFLGRSVPDGVPVPAHALDEYRHTASLVDRATDPRVTVAVGALAVTGATAAAMSAPTRSVRRATTTLYRAERLR